LLSPDAARAAREAGVLYSLVNVYAVVETPTTTR